MGTNRANTKHVPGHVVSATNNPSILTFGAPMMVIEVTKVTSTPIVKVQADYGSGTVRSIGCVHLDGASAETFIPPDTNTVALAVQDVLQIPCLGAQSIQITYVSGTSATFSSSPYGTDSLSAYLLAKMAQEGTASLKTIDLTLTLETAAYVANDLFEDTRTLTNAVSKIDAGGYLTGLVLTDEQDQAAAAMEVVLMDQTSTVGTQGVAVAISDALSRNILGIVKVEASEWVDIGGAKVATLTMQNAKLPLPVKPASGTRDVGVAFITRGTPTNLADGFRARFTFQYGKQGS